MAVKIHTIQSVSFGTQAKMQRVPAIIFVAFLGSCLAQGPTKNIFDMLADNKDRFSSLSQYLEAAGLKSTLQGILKSGRNHQKFQVCSQVLFLCI